MAEGLSPEAAEKLLDRLAADYVMVQLHVGPPGANGTANVAQETDRVQATWAAATGNELASAADTAWTLVAAAEDYTYFSAWSTGGQFGFSGTVSAEAVKSGATFTIPAGELRATLPVAS